MAKAQRSVDVDDAKRLEQSRFGVRTSFIFEGNRLIHTIKDFSGERTFGADYEAIGVRTTSRLTLNNRGFAGRIIIIAFVIMLLGFGLDFVNDFLGGSVIFISAMAIFGLIACNLFNVFAVRFILIPLTPSPPEAQGHPLRIIDGDSSARIIDELTIRRKTRLKALYGKPGSSREPAEEMARISWLRDNDVISQEEFETEAVRIERGSDDQSGMPGRDRLN